MADVANPEKPAPATTPGPAAGAGAEDVSNEALLAGLKGAEPDPDPADPDGPETEEPEPDDEDDDEGEAGPAADEDDEDAEEPDEDDADELAAKDPELAKRLRVIRQTEHRQREALARDRAAFDRERAEWQAQARQVVGAQRDFEALKARAALSPYDVLKALGVPDKAMKYVAEQCYAHSEEAAGKPEYRAAATAARERREAAEELAEARREVKELKDGLTARERHAADDAALDTYLAKVARKASDATPITAKLIANRPKAARRELLVTANKLAGKLGRLPLAKELLAAHERKEARALKLRGIEPPVAATPAKPAAAAAKPAPNGKKPAAAAKPAAAPDVETPDADPKNVKIPSRDDLLRELQAERGSN